MGCVLSYRVWGPLTVMAGMLNNCALLLREMGEAEEAIAHVEQVSAYHGGWMMG